MCTAGPQAPTLAERSPARALRQIGWLANRVNTLNGRRYGDDPTIMAFNLANEVCVVALGV